MQQSLLDNGFFCFFYAGYEGRPELATCVDIARKDTQHFNFLRNLDIII